MDESIVLNDVSLFYLEASEYINENIIDLGDDHQLFLEEEKKGFWAKVWDGIKKFFQTIWNWIKKAFSWLFGGKNNVGKVGKIIDQYENVLRKILKDFQYLIDKKDPNAIEENYNKIVKSNLNPAENWDIENSKMLLGRFNKLFLVKEAQIFGAACKLNAKEFVNKKLISSENYNGQWNFLIGCEELIKNEIEYYDKNIIYAIFIVGLYRIIFNVIALSSFLNDIIVYLTVEFKTINNSVKANDAKKRFYEFKNILKSSDTEILLNSILGISQKLYIARFYASFGFIKADKIKKILEESSNFYKNNKKQLWEITNDFINKHFLKNNSNSPIIQIEQSNSFKEAREKILKIIDNKADNIDELEAAETYVKEYFDNYNKAITKSSEIAELQKLAKAQNIIPEQDIIELLNEVSKLNSVYISLFNSMQIYKDINQTEVNMMELQIARNN